MCGRGYAPIQPTKDLMKATSRQGKKAEYLQKLESLFRAMDEERCQTVHENICSREMILRETA